MSSLLQLIGHFIAVLVTAAFMHFGALLVSDTADSAESAQTTQSKTATSESDTKKDAADTNDAKKETPAPTVAPKR
jgi:hypothetical protein